jgi:hypothetical protein
MTRENKIKEIVQILDNSDIVWTRYGADTKESLAERILNKIEEKRD